MARVGIALGSNLGDRIANLRSARDRLRRIATPGEPFLQAPTYQTEPLLCPPGSPTFYNSVVEIDYAGDPFDLLILTRAIEIDMGRNANHEQNAPRLIDVDLLYFGDALIETVSLVLPHPRLRERRFVLQPLADIRPDLILPGQRVDVATLLGELASAEPPLVRLADEQPTR